MRRAVAAGSFDLLLLETINSIRNKYKDDLESGVEVLDKLGFDVGRRLVEKYPILSFSFSFLIHSFILFTFVRTSQDRNRFQNTLDVIKFLCKDFFIETFGKQVDNLRTNHRVKCVLFIFLLKKKRNSKILKLKKYYLVK